MESWKAGKGEGSARREEEEQSLITGEKCGRERINLEINSNTCYFLLVLCECYFLK